MADFEHESDYIDTGTKMVERPQHTPPGQTQMPAEAPSRAVFNPLDANTVQFGQQLANRQDNYNQLREYLRNALVPDKDFGKIHVAKNCSNKYNCNNPGHFSPYTLFSPGSDKILSILGLGCSYDDVMQDYRRASLKGIKINEIFMTARISSSAGGDPIAEGSGACTLAERSGKINDALKIAQKRARLDAVSRLPGVSALFDEDFFASIVPQNRPTYQPAQTNAQREAEGPKPSAGKEIPTMPFGKHKGKRWSEMTDSMLHWCVQNIKDKPDVAYSADKELKRRQLQSEEVDTSVRGSQRPQETRKAPPVQRHTPQPEISHSQPSPGPDHVFDDLADVEGIPPRNQAVDEDDGLGWGDDAFSDLDDDKPPLDAYR